MRVCHYVGHRYLGMMFAQCHRTGGGVVCLRSTHLGQDEASMSPLLCVPCGSKACPTGSYLSLDIWVANA